MSVARKMLFNDTGFSIVSIVKGPDMIYDSVTKRGKITRHIVDFYPLGCTYPKDEFFDNKEMVLVTDPEDPRIAECDRDAVRIMLKYYYPGLRESASNNSAE